MGVTRRLSIFTADVVPGGAKGLEPLNPLLAKEVAAPAGPAAAQVKGTAVCSVNDRESPWVTLLTGTPRARAEVLVHSPPRRPTTLSRTAAAPAGNQSASRIGNCSNVPGA